MKYQFIEEHRDEYPITVMCRVLGVSRSGYYAWRKRTPSAREMANQTLWSRIKRIYDQSGGSYGSPRIQAELVDQGFQCGENRVARLMRRHGLRATAGVRFKLVTTDPNHPYPIAPNLLDQNFTAEQQDQIWLADITYIPTAEGWLYLAGVLDLYSRRIVGWAMSDSLERWLTLEALQMAIATRQPPAGLLHHSDRGSQYACDDYQALLTKSKMVCSMSRTGNCYDNAPMESFFGTLKTELVHQRQYRTRAEARTDIFQYLEYFYNRFRRHSALDYKSPVTFERLSFGS